MRPPGAAGRGGKGNGTPEEREVRALADELEDLVIEALSEGEKFMPDIFLWIEAKTGSRRLMGDSVLRGALDRLLAAGLVEVAYVDFRAPEDPLPLECYRLSADGWKDLWVGREERTGLVGSGASRTDRTG